MLAVVQHDQHLTVGDKTGQGVHGGAAGLVGQAKGADSGDRHQLGVGDRRQIHVPHAIAELAGKLARDLDGQAGFTGSAGTGQGQKSVLGQQLAHLGQLLVASNKTGQLHRKPFGSNGFRGAQRWELVDHIGMA